jgi:hypothetical protein
VKFDALKYIYFLVAKRRSFDSLRAETMSFEAQFRRSMMIEAFLYLAYMFAGLLIFHYSTTSIY